MDGWCTEEWEWMNEKQLATQTRPPSLLPQSGYQELAGSIHPHPPGSYDFLPVWLGIPFFHPPSRMKRCVTK